MRAFLTYGLIAVFLLLAVDADAARRRKKRKRRGSKGTIELVTATEGASVYLDGKLWGKTPLKALKIAPATYTVTVKKLGHLEFEQKVKVERKKTVTVRAQLLPYAGVVRVSSSLPGAKVFVDGTDRGSAPARFELRAGEHEVVIQAGEQTLTRSITAVAGEEIQIAATFEESTAVAEAGTADEDLALAPLALAPLAPTAGPAASASAGEDDLALVAPGTESAEEDSLALVVPEAGGDELDLVAPEDAAPRDDENGELAIVPLDLPAGSSATDDPLNPASMSTQVSSAPSWYEEWWVWTAGGAVVVAAVATTFALSGGGEDTGPPPADRIFRTEGNPDVGTQLPSP